MNSFRWTIWAAAKIFGIILQYTVEIDICFMTTKASLMIQTQWLNAKKRMDNMLSVFAHILMHDQPYLSMHACPQKLSSLGSYVTSFLGPSQSKTQSQYIPISWTVLEDLPFRPLHQSLSAHTFCAPVSAWPRMLQVTCKKATCMVHCSCQTFLCTPSEIEMISPMHQFCARSTLTSQMSLCLERGPKRNNNPMEVKREND